MVKMYHIIELLQIIAFLTNYLNYENELYAE